MPLISTLVDDFEDGVRNAALWNAWDTPPIYEAGGRLYWSSITGNYKVIATGTWDLLNSQIVFDTNLEGGMSLGNNYFELVAQHNGLYRVGFRRLGLNINWIYGQNTVAGSGTAYSSTTHRYLRIRSVNYTVYWETSPDAVTWATQWTQSVSSGTYPLTGMQVLIGISNYQGTVLSRSPALYAVNPAPAPTGPKTWVWDGTTKIAATPKVWDGTNKVAATVTIA